jgi:hypothetical protein
VSCGPPSLVSTIEREHLLPVALHAGDGPAAPRRLVERLVEPPDMRVAVIGPFALGNGREQGGGPAVPPSRMLRRSRRWRALSSVEV